MIVVCEKEIKQQLQLDEIFNFLYLKSFCKLERLLLKGKIIDDKVSCYNLKILHFISTMVG